MYMLIKGYSIFEVTPPGPQKIGPPHPPDSDFFWTPPYPNSDFFSTKNNVVWGVRLWFLNRSCREVGQHFRPIPEGGGSTFSDYFRGVTQHFGPLPSGVGRHFANVVRGYSPGVKSIKLFTIVNINVQSKDMRKGHESCIV